ncbi:MAG: hypothetical protein NVSMB25_07860 [Thermoleophilaceae bacterium]
MNSALLPDLSMWLDEQRVTIQVLLSAVDGRSMMLNAFVSFGEHELHSSYLDAGGETVVASHLLVVPDLPPEPSTETISDRFLMRAADRRLCLLDHLALLRDALDAGAGHAVRLEVGEAALRIVDLASPR